MRILLDSVGRSLSLKIKWQPEKMLHDIKREDLQALREVQLVTNGESYYLRTELQSVICNRL